MIEISKKYSRTAYVVLIGEIMAMCELVYESYGNLNIQKDTGNEHRKY